jgi:5-methylcytosine-specific restriction endonuclease McrA
VRAEFSKATKRDAWLRCHRDGIPYCEGPCGQPIGGRRPEYDHIVAAELGGSNDLDNVQVLCPKCHRAKTSLEDIPCIAKSNRVRDKHAGLKRSTYRWPKRKFSRPYGD